MVKRTCEASDCDKVHLAKGYCTKHYQQLMAHGRLSPETQKEFHGMASTPIYAIYMSMLRRCYNTNHKQYSDYGGRGITVCERWHKFSNFYKDMGERPKNRSLDRINNDGGYSPDNCRWATHKEQRNNTRRRARELYKGKNAMDWAAELNAHYGSFRSYKLRYGFEEAIEHYRDQIRKRSQTT